MAIAMSLINIFVVPPVFDWYKQDEVRLQDLPKDTIILTVQDYLSDSAIDEHVRQVLKGETNGR